VGVKPTSRCLLGSRWQLVDTQQRLQAFEREFDIP
jgi:hypothetical protein